MPGGDLICQEYAARVDGEVEIPVRVGEVESAVHRRHASVRDADVAAAQKLERLAERALDRGALAHVDLNSDCAFANLLRCSLGGLGVDIGDRHLHAASRERGGDCAADAIRAARYKRPFAAKLRIGRTVCRHHPPAGSQGKSYQQSREPRRRFFVDNLALGASLRRANREIPSTFGAIVKRLLRLRNFGMVFDFLGDKTKVMIAMAHIGALPGSPLYDVDGGVGKLIEGVLKDIDALQTGGVDAIMFGNENDRPYVLKAPPEGIAAMTAVIQAVKPHLKIPFGVNYLWDPLASVAIAAATGASFVREIFTGLFASDMGLWQADCAAPSGCATVSAATT